VHLLTPLLELPYAFARRQTRCLHSLLEVGSINGVFPWAPSSLTGTPVRGWVAEEGWQGRKGHGSFSHEWEMQERWRGLTRRT